VRIAAPRALGDVYILPSAAAAGASVLGFRREPSEELALFVHVHHLDGLALRARRRELRSRL